MAGLLSIMMMLSVLVSPFAGASAAETTPINASGSLDIRIPRNGSDVNGKARQMRYFKISDTELTNEQLQAASLKYDAMSIEDIVKELGQEGTLTEASKAEPANAPTHDVMAVRGVAPGAYIFKETKESADSHEFKIIAIAWNAESGATSTANAKTKRPEKPLILHKIAYDKASKEEKTIDLEGVHFDLLNEKGEKVRLRSTAKGQYIYDANANEVDTTTDLVTNPTGNIVVNGLPAGKYTFVETKTIAPYVLYDRAEDNKYSFDFIPAQGYTLPDVVNSEPKDKGTGFKITLHKYDGNDRNKRLAGAEFRLYVKTGTSYVPVGYDADGDFIIENGADHIFKTDAQGKIEIDGLPELPEESKYVFREVKAPAGYVSNTDTFYEAKRNGVVDVLNFTNPTPINLTLTKTDGITKNPIDRVGFELYRVRPTENAENITLSTTTERVALAGKNGKYEFRENINQADQVYQLYTDTNGQIVVTGLADGQYYFRENEPANGYNLAENRGKESERLNRTKNSTTLTNRPVTPPTVNPPTPDEPNGGYRFIKVDDSEEQKRLAGALFAVYRLDENGRPSPYEANGRRLTIRSGENGEFELTNLPYGKYILRETTAPAGHVLDVNPIEFEITATSYQNEARMIVNKRTPGRPTVPPVVSPPGTTPPTVTPPTTTPPRQTVPPVVNPPSTTPPRQSVPPVVSPPGTTYYVPSDTPGIPRGPLVKTGDIRIVILVAVGILMIIGGSVLVRKGEKDQGLLLA